MRRVLRSTVAVGALALAAAWYISHCIGRARTCTSRVLPGRPRPEVVEHGRLREPADGIRWDRNRFGRRHGFVDRFVDVGITGHGAVIG